jgi:hypothetical protein
MTLKATDNDSQILRTVDMLTFLNHSRHDSPLSAFVHASAFVPAFNRYNRYTRFESSQTNQVREQIGELCQLSSCRSAIWREQWKDLSRFTLHVLGYQEMNGNEENSSCVAIKTFGEMLKSNA